jgi:hypothetical protein
MFVLVRVLNTRDLIQFLWLSTPNSLWFMSGKPLTKQWVWKIK